MSWKSTSETATFKAAAQAIFQTAQHLPLVLQGLGVFDVEVQRKEARRPPSDKGYVGHLFGHEGFDDIALLDVIEVLDAHAALLPGAHFVDIVLEAPQRAELAGVDHDAVAQQMDLRALGDAAFLNHAAGDGSDL